jgi:hypothetical protein
MSYEVVKKPYEFLRILKAIGMKETLHTMHHMYQSKDANIALSQGHRELGLHKSSSLSSSLSSSSMPYKEQREPTFDSTFPIKP